MEQVIDLRNISEKEKSSFSQTIDDLVWSEDISYIEAVTYYCESVGMEIEVAALLVGDWLKSKIEGEAIQMKYLPKGSQLPL